MADQSFIDNIDQREGVFAPERFQDPRVAGMTANAKNVTSQINKLWSAGDSDVRAAVRSYEKESLKNVYMDNEAGRQRMKADMSDGQGKLSESTTWDIFYDAHQRYIAQRLLDENKGPAFGSDEYNFLSRMYKFDMEGRPIFDFDRIRSKLKIPGVDK
jgi:hypothetical protein